MAHKTHHDLLKLFGGHLPVANFHARLWHKRLDALGGAVKSMNAIVHVINLALARQFAVNGLLQTLGGHGQNFSDNGAPIRGRRGQTGDIAQPQQRHVQGARNGRGAEREHIGRGAK